MRAVVQCVKQASVTIDGNVYSSINKGILCLLGIKENDNDTDIKYIIDKLINLRVFRDNDDKMNFSVKDICGEVLIVSQFTLYGDARKGRRPSYDMAARGDIARPIYETFLTMLKNNIDETKVKTGVFAAMMDISLINNGPCTILLDSEKKF